MSNYELWLLDGVSEPVKLDTEDLNIQTTFNVAEMADISTRKDTITTTVLIKGTKTNNIAFGSMFHANKTSTEGDLTKFGFNYNPLRAVDCWVYEDGVLLFNGSLRVLEVDLTKDNEVFYSTFITGKFIDFKNLITDKKLTDLDFSDLAHTYNYTNIIDTWAAPLGVGYLYPFIDYGIVFNPAATNYTSYVNDVSKVNVLNFRPGIYVAEYLNRILNQLNWTKDPTTGILTETNPVGAPTYTYEIKGSDDFIAKFKSLIIPDASATFSEPQLGKLTSFDSSTGDSQVGSSIAIPAGTKLLKVQTVVQPTGIDPYVALYSTDVDVLEIKRNFTADAEISVNLSNLKNSYTAPAELQIQLVQRPTANNVFSGDIAGWQSIASTSFEIPGLTTVGITKNFTLQVASTNYLIGNQLGIRMYWVGTPDSYAVAFDVDSVSVSFPKNIFTAFTVDVSYDSADTITPQAPDGISQMDFIKSIINLFNFYVYSKKGNETHLIF